LRSRRDSSDPVRTSPTGATLSDRGAVCQDFGQTSPSFRLRSSEARTNLEVEDRAPGVTGA
jgi:hypothetical protein